MQLDVVIFGGGAAGLWLLDELAARNHTVLLLEANQLGCGQTVASQGIIHGGLKYSLQDLLTRAAGQIRDMPLVWRECLAGRRQPNLRGTSIRSEFCYLWRTDSAASRLGMLGAKIGLRVAPQTVLQEQRPHVLANCPGCIARLDEPVIAPDSFLHVLAERSADRILKTDARQGVTFHSTRQGMVDSIRLWHPESGQAVDLRPRHIVLSAGRGNARLLEMAGLPSTIMQRRPLHMVMLRGDLPSFCGHCVDGAKTRVTITSDFDSTGRSIWQVGGQVAEVGVQLDGPALIRHTAAELRAVMPGFDPGAVEWATYRVDRAEAATPNGHRPDQVQVIQQGNVITAWPTKLALVPQLTDAILERVTTSGNSRSPMPSILDDWPRPSVALPPWETCTQWSRLPGSAGVDALREEAA